MRKLKFQEGEALRAEEEMRKRDLKLTMIRKLGELRQVYREQSVYHRKYTFESILVQSVNIKIATG